MTYEQAKIPLHILIIYKYSASHMLIFAPKVAKKAHFLTQQKIYKKILKNLQKTLYNFSVMKYNSITLFN